ncbi:MAG: hypothetical protein LH632_12360 [Rhodoferax sp.]|nr:hypothetical protein [Rhodoferax sp.]
MANTAAAAPASPNSQPKARNNAFCRDGSFDAPGRDGGIAGGVDLGGIDTVKQRISIIKMEFAIVG